MENKIYLKKTIKKVLITIVLFLLLFIVINYIEYRLYNKNYNDKLISISNNIKDKYPSIKDSEIISLIIEDNNKENIFINYGYQNEDIVISKNNSAFNKYIIIDVLIFIVFSIIITFLYLKHNKKKDEEIEAIIKLIEEINHHNYNFDIDIENEDELSILKNEIYKTTIMLRTIADNSIKDKKYLKDTLEDISHQLKTPLTSIVINLDNIMDNQLDKESEELFLRKIKKDVYNIKLLVDNLLKLSKFDVNRVTYQRKEEYIKDIIDACIDNVSSLADLKNIKIVVTGSIYDKIICDKMWQTEAITNIIKNAIEHSYTGETVYITYKSCKTYNSIMITNRGNTISSNDKKHIFDRFYKSETANSDSVGIGLSLAKAIIQNDNGMILLESEDNVTKFIIKYKKDFKIN